MKQFIAVGFASFIISLSAATASADDVRTLAISLQQAEESTFANSPLFKAATLDAESSNEHAQSQLAQLFPKLSFEAMYRHVSEVASFKPVPTAPAVSLGDNKNYSYGPQISWNAWTSGFLYNKWKTAKAQAASKRADQDALKRQLLLECRLNYFQVQLALEQQRLLADSLKLAEAQYNDISLQQRAGTLSRIDALSTHQEVLNRTREFLEAQSQVAASLRNLFALTGLHEGEMGSRPLDIRIQKLPASIGDGASVLVSLDPIAQASQKLEPSMNAHFNANHPKLASLSEAVRAARLTADGLKSGHGPTVQVYAKASRDYPNGPILESFNQKTIGVNASFPLFEMNRVVNDVKAQNAQASSLEEKKNQAATDLERDFNKSHDQLTALLSERDINKTAIRETESLATLVYDSYRAGRSNYIEVESANLKALQAKVISARAETQILIQLAILDSLSE